MISLIICSRNSDLSNELKENIKNSIGVDYELIIIDNSKNVFSIFEAYNEGVKRSKGHYLCFMHDDILYHTPSWGVNIINHFQRDEKIGLIGVVGTNYLPNTPSYWCYSGVLSGKLIQGWTENGIYKTEKIEHVKYLKNKNYIEAVAVDGLWFCIPKSIFSIISFDENSYNRFHFYDMDICLQIIQNKFKVEIIMDVLIEHFSYGNGNVDSDFNNAKKSFYEKWKPFLPIMTGVELSESEQIKIKKEIEHSERLINRKKSIYFIILKKTIKFLKIFEFFG